ncbi:metal ABC transporter ATP-binding protein [Lapillicoccus sp.]|uniref:metal ABC transporter ATP-binding protein n=1 Tax=Lapillicoccus sp. TaxID=1909287 RepID=UPI0025DA529E|nr:metal ABC transporter ATP-binding protein [Lapillicoccus sp.]
MFVTASAPEVDGASTAPPIISLRSASFGYADRAVVSDVTLDVRAGEVVAVLGPNGSGKSTLVRGLLGLTQHLGGDLELFGVPRDRFRDHARVGYVPQRHTLSTSVRATVEEIVATGRLVRQSWFDRPNRTDQSVIDRALDVVGLADRARADVTTLSGGQQRRVLIARALASQPDVLIMDEPTAGVDTANQHVLAEVLGRLAAQGVTMVIVTHEMDAFVDVVTRVVVIDNGRVSFDGPADDFGRQSGAVLHEHHTHHHDDEMRRAAGLPGTPGAGPLDRSGGRRA